ncbi:MAG: AarF/ABC1/UbiB kinase family protein [Planctomycetota bacterium]
MSWQELLDESALASLLPDELAHFSKPVCYGLAVFLDGLPEVKQAQVLADQASLGPDADVAERLGKLAHASPVLQKIGQVLARDQRLDPELRRRLRTLESLPPRVPWDTIERVLDAELSGLDLRRITLTPPALAEASVAVVVPFQAQLQGGLRHGVFKVLKPGIEEQLSLELDLLNRVGEALDERCDELGIPHLNYGGIFERVGAKLREEVRLDREQQLLAEARAFYAPDDRVLVPALFDCCTPRVTAMERVWGQKVTDHGFQSGTEAARLAGLIAHALVARPVFSLEQSAPFHSDPHAGNLFLANDGRLALLDWSLVGRLDRGLRACVVRLVLAAVLHHGKRMVDELSCMAGSGQPDRPALARVVHKSLRRLRRGQLPGLLWLIELLDNAVSEAGLQLEPDLVLYRKTLYTLSGVVAEVGGGPDTFDRVLWFEFLKHLTIEWPFRWFASPGSRRFASNLSSFDLTRAILGAPAAGGRYWIGQAKDLLGPATKPLAGASAAATN